MPKPTNPHAFDYAYFAQNTADHVLTVCKDDGAVDRRLYVGEPGTSMFHWQIVTWPGYLATGGDIADGYVFTRTHDMFEFFAHSTPNQYTDGAPRIDFSYWAQKLAGNRREGVYRFSSEKFRGTVREWAHEAGRSVPAEVADVAGFRQSAETWMHENAGEGIVPGDWYEYTFEEFDVAFLYACWAIEKTLRLWTKHKEDVDG